MSTAESSQPPPAHPATATPVGTDPHASHLSTLTHDLRVSANSLLLQTEILRRDLAEHPELAESRADVDCLRSSILELLGTAERHICVERLRLGLVRLRSSPLDLKVLARDLTDRYAQSAADSRFALEILGDGVALTDCALFSLAAAALLDHTLAHATPPLAKLSLTVVSPTQPHPGHWSITAESLGDLSDLHRKQLAIPPRPNELIPGDPAVPGLNLLRHIAHTLGATLSTSPPGPNLRIELSGQSF